MSVNNPKVFISYSWVVSEKVKELSERLYDNGIIAVLDKWDLKEGQDKYVFMEQAVNDPEITRVLIVCDKSYAQKANDRTGGVGDETVIISPEIYGKTEQEKFIPLIFEKDENNKPYMPAYIKSRIYIDLSTEDIYEEEYERLLRNIIGKPEHKKPKLGKIPEWLNEEDVSLSAVRGLIKQLKGYNGGNSSKADFLVRRAVDEFSNSLKELGLPLDKPLDEDLFLKRIDASKLIRDYFIDYIEVLIEKDLPVGDIAGNFFENLYNNVIDTKPLTQYYPANLEFYYFYIWESFVCAITILLHYEKYNEINKILTRTYFLYERTSGEMAYTFVEFRKPFQVIEEICKQNTHQELLTLAGDIVIKREKKPIITKESIVNADLILYQMSCALLDKDSWKWFPTLYIYGLGFQRQTIWTKLKSKRYCEKIFPLFGVNSIEELKKMIAKCVYDNQYKYSDIYCNHRILSTHYAASNILSNIRLEEIGVLN